MLGWYVGGNAGQSRTSTGDSDIATGLAAFGITGTGSSDSSATAGKVFFGYQFHENFAVEGGYVYLGSYNVNGVITAPVAATFTGSTKLQGGNIDLVGILPFGGQVSGIGRVGAAYLRGESSATVTAGGLAGYGSASNNKTVGTAGLGLQYDFTKTVAGRLEWQRYFNVNNGTSNSGSIDLYTLGIAVRF
jgi:OOP family OmpA-OmpF porin